MTTTVPEQQSNAGRAALVPPEEKFWQRYSPHREMPVSLAGSLLLHGLVLGVLLLLAWLGWAGFRKPAGALPVEPVSLAPAAKVGPAVPASGGNGGVPLVGDPNPGQPAAQPEPKRPTLDPGPAVVPPGLP